MLKIIPSQGYLVNRSFSDNLHEDCDISRAGFSCIQVYFIFSRESGNDFKKSSQSKNIKIIFYLLYNNL